MKIVYVVLSILMFSNISCKNKDMPIDNFFYSLENSIDRHKLIIFKNAPRDSALFYFKEFENDFLKIYQDSAQSMICNNFLNSIHVANHTETRVYFLCFAFHARLNHQTFNSNEIMQETYRERLKIKEEWDKKERYLKLKNKNN